MKRQVCTNCIAFDLFLEYCALGNTVVREMEETYIAEFGKAVKLPKFYPATKCNKPKTKADFYNFVRDLNYQKNQK